MSRILSFTIRPHSATSPLFKCDDIDHAAKTAKMLLGEHDAVVIGPNIGGGGTAWTWSQVDQIIGRAVLAGRKKKAMPRAS